MKKWYWRRRASGSSFSDWWAYGKGGEKVRWPHEVTDDWLREFGFATRAAAVRAAGGNYMINMFKCLIDSREIDDDGLHYEIYRCYEIVIRDKDGNQIGESDYVYTGHADAVSMAKHKLKMTKEEC